jgi:hypothetical protein
MAETRNPWPSPQLSRLAITSSIFDFICFIVWVCVLFCLVFINNNFYFGALNLDFVKK